MHDFTYLEPTTAQEACQLLRECGEDSRIISGGTALLLGMRQRMLSPTHLISLGKIDDLSNIEFEPGVGLSIGARARHADIASSAVIQEHFPMLADMARQVANPQVRNAGTLGGNLCYGDPATDPPGCLMALGAQLVIAGPEGERLLPIEDFLVDYFQTALGPDEILTHVLVPALPDDAIGSYTRFLRTAAEHRPLVNVALLARVENGTHCKEIRMALGASTPTAVRLTPAEQLLAGQTLTPVLAAEAANIAVQHINPISDSRGTADYRKDMAHVVIRRALINLFGLTAQ